MKIEHHLDYRTILANRARPVCFAIKFEAENLSHPRPRPAAFCVVLDRSGSMGGAPLQKAREAAQVAVRNLRPEDQFSLVVFDGDAQTLIPLQPATNKQSWLELIGKIEDGGSTNLTGGWMLGRDELKKAAAETTRRLLLLSDGQLNQGIVEPPVVRQVVVSGLEQDRVRTSCLGFGEGYNEDLMAELARVTGGQFYDAQSPEKLPAIFASELEGLQKLSVQNLRLRFQRLDFCDRAALLGNYPVIQLPDGRNEIAVGDLVSGETRVLCFELGVLPLPWLGGTPVCSLQGEPLLELELLFDELGESSVTSKTVKQTIRIQATQNPGDVKVQEEVVSWVAMQKAGRALEEMTKKMDSGKSAEAAALLAKTIAHLKAYGPAERVAEAVRLLEELRQKVEQGEYSLLERKSARYRSASYMKMSSAEHWSADAPAPSFKNHPRTRIPPPSPDDAVGKATGRS